MSVRNNIIRFPDLEKPDEGQGKLHSPAGSDNKLINLSDLKAKACKTADFINKTDSSCENTQVNKAVSNHQVEERARALSGKHIVSKLVSNIIHPPAEFWKEEEEKAPSGPSKEAEQTGGASPGGGGGPVGGSKKWNYMGVGAVCALCLMLTGFPFMNQKSASRGLASSDSSVLPVKIVKADGSRYTVRLHEDANRNLSMRLSAEEGRHPNSAVKPKGFWSLFASPDRNPDNSDKNKFKKMIRRQEKEALRLIHTGQRKISSVGQKPGVKDDFSIRLLKSRYDLRWRRDRLVYAKLLPNQDPVFVPNISEVFSRYRQLFPSYVQVTKLTGQNGLNDVYELKNAKGLNTARVEVKKDEKGGLLSIHSL